MSDDETAAMAAMLHNGKDDLRKEIGEESARQRVGQGRYERLGICSKLEACEMKALPRQSFHSRR
jgi:hypothetical protein